MVGEEQSQRVYSFEDLLEEQGYIVYTNVGTSMLPLLRQRRDIIEIRKKDPNVRCKKYDAVLYKVGTRYILHRIIKVLPDSYVIVGDHCIYREYGIRDEQILGIMTRVIRDGKDIRVTDWQYQVYVHLWCDFYPIRAGILFGKNQAWRAWKKLRRG